MTSIHPFSLSQDVKVMFLINLHIFFVDDDIIISSHSCFLFQNKLYNNFGFLVKNFSYQVDFARDRFQ